MPCLGKMKEAPGSAGPRSAAPLSTNEVGMGRKTTFTEIKSSQEASSTLSRVESKEQSKYMEQQTVALLQL